jgi:hypothetical protein
VHSKSWLQHMRHCRTSRNRKLAWKRRFWQRASESCVLRRTRRLQSRLRPPSARARPRCVLSCKAMQRSGNGRLRCGWQPTRLWRSKHNALNEARRNEAAALRAAERGLQAHEGLLRQARAQQQRLGNVAKLQVCVAHAVHFMLLRLHFLLVLHSCDSRQRSNLEPATESSMLQGTGTGSMTMVMASGKEKSQSSAVTAPPLSRHDTAKAVSACSSDASSTKQPCARASHSGRQSRSMAPSDHLDSGHASTAALHDVLQGQQRVQQALQHAAVQVESQLPEIDSKLASDAFAAAPHALQVWPETRCMLSRCGMGMQLTACASG